MIPGEVQTADGAITINEGRETISLRVTNTGDRAIQVGSHYHFFEVNPALEFDREKTYGYRLDKPAGLSVRIEPGLSITLRMVPFAGERTIYGFRGWVDGKLDDPEIRQRAMQRMKDNYNPGQDAQRGQQGGVGAKEGA